MSYRILIAETFYEQYLEDYYRRNPNVVELPYDEQHAHLVAERFGSGDSYVAGLRAQGCEASTVVLNARPLQRRWAHEQGLDIPDGPGKWDADVFIAQVRAMRPDVVYMQEISVAGDDVIESIKPFTRLVVGQIACSLPPRRTFRSHDLILSSFRPIVEYFRARGQPSEPFRLAFDSGVLPQVADQARRYDVTFVGGLSSVHAERIGLLEYLAGNTAIDIFGYGSETLPDDSAIHKCHRGQSWGIHTFRTMAASAITINCHGTIAVPGGASTNLANNLRLFEATGVGAMLLTDWKEDLGELFAPGTEVVTYRHPHECLEKVRHYLAHDGERLAIARAGQRRALGEHTYEHRMQELVDLLGPYL